MAPRTLSPTARRERMPSSVAPFAPSGENFANNMYVLIVRAPPNTSGVTAVTVADALSYRLGTRNGPPPPIVGERWLCSALYGIERVFACLLVLYRLVPHG